MMRFWKRQKKENGLKISKRTTIIIRIFSAVCTATFLVVSVLILESLLSMGILPLKYMWIVIATLTILLIIGILMFFLSKNHKILAVVFGIIHIATSGVICWGYSYLYDTREFFSQTGAKDHYVINYSVFVMKDSEYQSIDDLDGKRDASYIDTLDSYNEAFEQLKNTIEFSTVIKDTYADAARALMSGEADFVLLNDTYISIIDDMEEGFSEKIRSVHEIEIKIYDVFDATDVDVLGEPFNIYISGLDAIGDISEVSRSDVNMIVTVNPIVHKILLTSIPRDYYVQLHGTTGIKDKLTHSGIYGPKMTVKTVEDLLGIKINYYIRANYSSVIKLVDAIGGVYLTPDITLHRNHYETTCYYYAGVRTLYNGPCALRYARERKAYGDGDMHRIQNQQQVLMAIFDKLSSVEILKNYSNILSAIEGSIETSIPENKFYQIINHQLDNMPKWSIENYYLNGTGSYAGIYSSDVSGTGNNGSNYYVMEPDMATVEAAKAKIEAVFAE